MSYLKINEQNLNPSTEEALIASCPFSAISRENWRLTISSGCKMCKLCLKNGPAGSIELVEDAALPEVDKTAWNGIAVYVDHQGGNVHPVTFELIGKARELAQVTGQPVSAVFIGHNIQAQAQDILRYGVDHLYVFDAPALAEFAIDTYTNAFCAFVEQTHPSAIIIGATNIGRSIAPRVACRFRTGLTADCTKLEMRENTDLVQIRPAFGGNIMAQIVTPRHRPQMCTVRYKIFSAPEPTDQPHGQIIRLSLPPQQLQSVVEILQTIEKPKEMDISEAPVIVAMGRGVTTDKGREQVLRLAELLQAQIAGTRPLVEAGIIDPRRQIGLSGRTVKPNLIITCGISGAVQFTAGMKGADCIIAINTDKNAPIFDVAHYGLVGDCQEIISLLLERLNNKEGADV